MTTRIVFGGEAGSGKSTLAASVFKCLQTDNISVGLHEIDVYSDTIPCLLGAKEWSKRKKRKKAWFEPTIRKAIEAFVADKNNLVLGDLPGKVTNPFIGKMIAPADLAIIVYRKGSRGFKDWQILFEKSGIPILTYVCSELNGQMELPFSPLPNSNKPLIYIEGLDRKIVINDDIKFLCQLLTKVLRP